MWAVYFFFFPSSFLCLSTYQHLMPSGSNNPPSLRSSPSGAQFFVVAFCLRALGHVELGIGFCFIVYFVTSPGPM